MFERILEGMNQPGGKTRLPVRQRPAFRTMLGRALRLRCPRCGDGKLFDGWIRMRSDCTICELHYEREPGFFLGSIYFNYGVTAMILTLTFFGLFLGWDVSPDRLLWPLAAFCLLFPVWFFRYARSLWLGFDQFWDPR
jgi:uncharacterized protein (DUF983 family)